MEEIALLHLVDNAMKSNTRQLLSPPDRLYVCGIDTDIGKTYGTAFLIRTLREAGYTACTSMKLVQTGCHEISEDIETHRRLLGEPLSEWDRQGLTCPYLYSYPCSPHLAARMDGGEIDPKRLNEATRHLQELGAKPLLVECAGGLMVPLTEHLLTIDYIAQQENPQVALVTNGKLGSINHTLLSIDACMHRGIEVRYLIYNVYPEQDDTIERETISYLQGWLEEHLPSCLFMKMPIAG